MAKKPTETEAADESAAQNGNAETSILTKMTVSTMSCNPGEAKAKNEKVLVARITGTASGIKAAVGKDGDPVTGLTGEFYGAAMQSGKVFQSGVLYLPSGIAELLISAVEGDGELGADKRPIYNQVEFAFDIFAVPAKNPIGYSYEAKSLIQARANPTRDRYLALLRTGKEQPTALPAS